MKLFIFRVTIEGIRCVCEVESKQKIEFVPRTIECIGVVANDYGDAFVYADLIYKSRLAFLEIIRQNPIDSIGQRG